MSDLIQLLSDHIANQIAAGEVIQRPGSAVKELLENAIDAGASAIQLVVRDAGKELIQVIDNGCGMSPADARLSFERHATSKIRNIDDLFSIRTMGFRGEALASIAAVAQVEMRTRRPADEVGTRLVIEGSIVQFQEPYAAEIGTNIQLKNLFFNVPARRHFLKSNNTEYRHILDEFTRIALAHPFVGFRLWHNGTEQYVLESGSLKSRIVGLMGSATEKNLVPVMENTGHLNIKGFIGKPETATRTRGNQYLFINNRFIRNNFLNHAISTAYERMIDKDCFPFYVLFLETDPARVDVNVHPTKQEVKFDDDKMMYAYLHAAIKHALASNNISPSIDFTLNQTITNLQSVNQPNEAERIESAQNSYLFQVFRQQNQAHVIEKTNALRQWKDLYAIAQQTNTSRSPQSSQPVETPNLVPESVLSSGQNIMLVQQALLITTVKSGVMVIHIRRAQERIWYERLLAQWNEGETPSQQMLFPVTYEVSPQEALLLQDVISDLGRIGFDIRPFGQNTFIVQGVPGDMPSGEEKNILDEVIEQLRHESSEAVLYRQDRILTQLARHLSRNKHAIQHPEGQQILIDELFACSQPEYTPDGKKVFTIVKKDALEQLLD